LTFFNWNETIKIFNLLIRNVLFLTFIGLMDSLLNNSLIEDNSIQSLVNIIDEREQIMEETIELDRKKAAEEAE